MPTSQIVSREKTKQIRIFDITAATSAYAVPGGHGITQIFFREKNNIAVTGGIKIGTSAGGTQIVAAAAVGASAFGSVPNASIAQSWFSANPATRQVLFIDAVTAWAGARVDLFIRLAKLVP